MHARNVLNELGECPLADAVAAVQMIVPLHVIRKYGSKTAAAMAAVKRCADMIDATTIRPRARKHSWLDRDGARRPWSAKIVALLRDGTPRTNADFKRELPECKPDTVIAYVSRFVRAGFARRDEHGVVTINTDWSGPTPDVHRSPKRAEGN